MQNFWEKIKAVFHWAPSEILEQRLVGDSGVGARHTQQRLRKRQS